MALALHTVKLFVFVCIFVVFVVYVSVQEATSPTTASCKDAVLHRFVHGIPGEDDGLAGVTTLQGALTYLNTRVVPTLDLLERLDGRRISTPEDLVVMGHPLFHAYFVTSDGCRLLPAFEKIFDECYRSYTGARAWRGRLPGVAYDTDARGFSSRATKTSYNAGAHAMPEAVFREEVALATSSMLLSPALRAIRVRLRFYSPNVDAVGSTDLIFEVTEAGLVVPAQDTIFVTLVRAPLKNGEGASASFGTDWSVLAFALAGSLAYLRILQVQHRSPGPFFRNVDFILCPNLVLLVAVAATRAISAYTLADAWPGALTDMDAGGKLVETAIDTFFYTKSLNAYNSLLTFAAVLFYFRQIPKCRQLIDSVAKASLDMVAILMLLCILLLGFATSLYLIYGQSDTHFRDLEESLATLFAASLGAFPSKDSITGQSVFVGPFLFVIFIATIQLGLFGLFVSLVDDAYGEVLEGEGGHAATTTLQAEFLMLRDYAVKSAIRVYRCLIHLGEPPIEASDEPTAGNAKVLSPTKDNCERAEAEHAEMRALGWELEEAQEERKAVAALRDRVALVAAQQGDLYMLLVQAVRLDAHVGCVPDSRHDQLHQRLSGDISPSPSGELYDGGSFPNKAENAGDSQPK